MKTLGYVVVFALFGSGTMATAQDRDEPNSDAQKDFLKQFVGEWSEVLEFSGGPDAATSKVEGTITFRLLGALCLIYDASGTWEGMEIKRHGMIGYDASEKKFALATVTNTSPKLLLSTGQLSPNGKQMVVESMRSDSETGASTKVKWVYELNDKDKDSFTMTYFETVGKGKETQHGKGIYSRRKK